jgi:hypothetical protein
MTQKQFKEDCSFHEYGRGQGKRNAIYYDWKSDFDNKAVGFRFMVKCTVADALKAELFKILYDWVMGGTAGKEIQLPWWVDYRYAITEQDRFKVSLMG